jgi:pimeloyl-ACP methyl ester carboxylesterase
VRVDSASATSRALGAFLDSCQAAGPAGCAFADAGTRGKFDTLMGRLRNGPITVQTPEGPVVATYAFLADALRGGLQYPPVWPFIAEQLQAIWTLSGPVAMAPPQRGTSSPAPLTRAPLADGYDNSREAQLSVLCGESANPPEPGLWPVYAALADVRTPYFGADWTYLSQPCATWPVRDQDRFSGQYNRKTANPVLFVNGTQDAASDLAQARTAASAMPGARLLVVDGPGHPASFLPNGCLGAATTAYLLDRHLPAANATCTPDIVPFS